MDRFAIAAAKVNRFRNQIRLPLRYTVSDLANGLQRAACMVASDRVDVNETVGR
ncbi:MAG: hypothetical protein OXP09_00700 [Gammaproteobacteria bacterium]|nr:hypothetical protein [Gammaproteobacteria bacterium]